jgi:hypothetical protein
MTSYKLSLRFHRPDGFRRGQQMRVAPLLMIAIKSRSYLKNVFWAKFCVGLSFQLLKILQYSCGLKLGPALTLSKNPIFEMASNE